MAGSGAGSAQVTGTSERGGRMPVRNPYPSRTLTSTDALSFRVRGQSFRRALRAPLTASRSGRPTRSNAMLALIPGALRLSVTLGSLPTGVNESTTIAATTFLHEGSGRRLNPRRGNERPEPQPSRPRALWVRAWIERPAPLPAMAKTLTSTGGLKIDSQPPGDAIRARGLVPEHGREGKASLLRASTGSFRLRAGVPRPALAHRARSPEPSMDARPRLRARPKAFRAPASCWHPRCPPRTGAPAPGYRRAAR